MRVSVIRWSVVVVALVVAGGGVWIFARRQSDTRTDASVLLISIDTCRADRLSCYGHTRATTPNIDALAREGLRFEHAVSPVPITLAAHASMLTGTYPPYHGVHGNIRYQLRPSNLTLAEILRGKGITTAAVVGAFMMEAKFGLAQGFDTYDADFQADRTTLRALNERSAEAVNRVALSWLNAHKDQPFFLFLHYFDPHHPYRPPEPFASTYPHDPYAGEIAYVDAQIGKLMEELKRLQRFDSTMIIITSDHGEALREHGELTHEYFVYHSTTRVPLVIKLPGRPGGRVVAQAVSLVDLTPTILDYLDIEAPPDLDGQSLLPVAGGGSLGEEPRFLYSESLAPTRFGCSSLLAMETRQWKYIQTTKPELYDLAKDPGETNNVVHQHPQQARAMRERLKRLLNTRVRTRRDDPAVALDADSLGRLESLGYVGGAGGAESFELETGREDPKDFLPYYLQLAQAGDLIRRSPRALIRVPTADGSTTTMNGYELASRICDRILAQRPDIAKAHAIAGRAAFELGDMAAADRHYTELARLSPDSAEAQNDLGYLRLRQGRLDEAIRQFNKAVDLLDDTAADDTNLDRALNRLGNVDPVMAAARFNLGDALFQKQDLAGAARVYREALQYRPADAKAHYVIGLDLARQNKITEAVASYRAALAASPNYAAARKALERALATEGP